MTDTLNDLTASLFAAKNEKAKHNEAIKQLNEEIKDLERRLWMLMNEDESNPMLKFTTPDGTVYISPQITPKVVDWNAFYGYIKQNEAFHMLQRRPSRAAFRELHEAHKIVPGVEAVEYDEVRTRKS